LTSRGKRKGRKRLNCQVDMIGEVWMQQEERKSCVRLGAGKEREGVFERC
jgi:hypothetical protein